MAEAIKKRQRELAHIEANTNKSKNSHKMMIPLINTLSGKTSTLLKF
ncbi:hypothetical protein VN0861_05180 [Helicobacter pylori]